MKIRATLTTVAIGAALAAGGLAGCGSDDDSDSDSQTQGESAEQTTTQQSSGGY